MIKSFGNKETMEVLKRGTSRVFPPDILIRAKRKLNHINDAAQLDDLKTPPSNRLHLLSGDKAGQFSISINDQWRICFRWIDGNAHDVEIVDYH